MDSGNSGSMQSSSGGDEEFDSRAESIPAFLNSSAQFGHISNSQHPSISHPPSFFDPPSNYLDNFSQSQANPNASSLLNHDAVWSRGLRSNPNCTDLGNIIGPSSSSSSSSSQSSMLGSIPLRSVHDNDARAGAPSDQTNIVRNSKKRTRASRRAPTTVLTTDTTNFRAMVQEFTGIPAPPFSASSYSRRLDLFATAGSAMRSSHLEPLGPIYPLRPSAQKVQPSPFLPSPSSPSFLNSSMVDAIASAGANIASTTNNTVTTSMAAATSNTFNPSFINHQLPSDQGLPKQPQNLLNMQNPIIKFQSLQPPLPSPLKYALGDIPVFGAKSQGSSAHIPALEELGITHGPPNANLSGFMQLRSDSNLTGWRDGAGPNMGSQDRLRSFNGNYGNSQQVSSCKLNCSAPSSVFHAEKGSENVPSRGEGTVDSWICPSD